MSADGEWASTSPHTSSRLSLDQSLPEIWQLSDSAIFSGFARHIYAEFRLDPSRLARNEIPSTTSGESNAQISTPTEASTPVEDKTAGVEQVDSMWISPVILVAC
jgi:hypothetical protein